MCLGENNAPQCSHYLNAQLNALYENSVGCVQRHGNGLQPDQGHRYSFALAEYYHGKHRRGQASKADMMFYAAFDKPRLDFICNHDAILRLTIKEGHYNTEFTKGAINPANADKNKTFSNVEVAFRVPFSVTGIRGQDLKLGDGDNVINLLVLEFTKAHLVSVAPELEAGRSALSYYLLEYLQLLQNSGNHVLFSLPDFDDDRRRVTIDFSANSQALLDIDEIYGVSVEKINTFLSSSWLKAAMLAGGKNGPSTDRAALSLAEYRSTWVLGDNSTYFHVKLGAPRIKALCNQEVVLYFVIDEALFYDSQDFTVAPKQTYQNCEIAVLVNVIHEQEEEGNVTRCKLDLNTCRFMRQFCNYSAFDQTNEEAVRYLTRLVDFFTSDYLDVLESAQYHVCYHYDARWPQLSGLEDAERIEEAEEESDSEDEAETEAEIAAAAAAAAVAVAAGEAGVETAAGAGAVEGGKAVASRAGRATRQASGQITRTIDGRVVTSHGVATTYVSKAAAWKEITEKTDMQGFDHVSAVSQAAINAYFKSLWTAAQSSKNAVDATLARYTYEQYFSSSFQPMNVRLLSNGRAIVWVHLQEGWLKTLRNWLPWSESAQYKFENWRLAFEVELKIVDHDKLDGVSAAWNAKFQDSFVFKHHGKSSDRVLKHIYLDFKNAEFIHEFSNFDGLFNSHDKRPIDKVQALVTYLQSYYFSSLVSSGLHVLYTLPVWKSGVSLPANALTDVTFQIYSKSVFDRRSWGRMTKDTEPVMLILGVTGFRALPAGQLKYSCSWVVRATKSISYGTVCISRKVFLDDRLLTLLARVNAITTIVSLPFALERGAWKLQLTTWSQSENRKDSNCRWVLDGDCSGILKYKWEHRDGWRYEHEGTADITNGSYSVDCNTKNYLEIPTVFKNGTLEIKIRGEVTLKIGVKGTAQNWSARSAAKWHTSLVLHSEADGLKISIVNPPTPVYEKAHIEGEVVSAFFTSPESLLKANLPTTVDLGEVLGLFKSFEGIWNGIYPGTSAYTLAQPVFNKNGDILFELRPHSQICASAPPVVKASSTHHTSRTTTTRTTSTIRPSMFSRPSLLQRVKNSLAGEKEKNHPQSNGKVNGEGHCPPPPPAQAEGPAPTPVKPDPKAKKVKAEAKPVENGEAPHC